MPNSFDPRELVLSDRVPVDRLIPAFFPRRPTVRILVVTDTAVSFTSSFGIGTVVDVIRANVDGYVRFQVDLARLGVQSSTLAVDGSPGPRAPKYENFRFSSQLDGEYIIDSYDQIWCFGFAPGNDGSSNDDNIWSSAYASTDADLAILTQWMNAGGGVLAMGDHHYLGAAMCARIPRVRSMRRWTNAQGVPPIGGPERLDTHRPQNATQDPAVTPSPAVIPFGAESDDVPQVIEWKRYHVSSIFPFQRGHRPHPLLCGGQYGVIDVLPDHPHEGWVYEDGEIDLGGTYDFGAASGDEYPTVGTVQARPEAIAWAHTLSDPPHNHFKGESPAKRFAVIGVYDGDKSEVGRVVVDSTWHHWMDMNLVGLQTESPDTEYQKVVRYFRNCAVWLAREGQRRQMLTYSAFWSILRAPAYEDFVAFKPLLTLGGKAIDVIGRMTSDCLVRDWLDVFIPNTLLEEIARPRLPLPDPCWTCPPVELIQQAVLGGLVKELIPLRDELDRLHADPDAALELCNESVQEAAVRGAQQGLARFHAVLEENLAALGGLTRLRDEPCKKARPRNKIALSPA